MSTKRFTMLFVLAIFFVAALPSQIYALQTSGDMDIDGYCRYLGYNGSRLDPTQQNVFGWGCLKSDGTQAGMDLYGLCKWQYNGSLPYPEYSNYDDPYSWFCSSEDLGSPASRPAPEVQQPSEPTTGIQGACPGFRNLATADVCLFRENDGSSWFHENPSFSSRKISEIPKNIRIRSYGNYVCAEGYTWEQGEVLDTGIGGWMATYNCDQPPAQPTPKPVVPPTPQPTLTPDFSDGQESDGSAKLNQCFSGQRFGTERDDKGLHHYVEFDVDSNLSAKDWKVTGPLWPDLFAFPINGKARAGFAWFDWPPVVIIQPSWFQLCAIQ